MRVSLNLSIGITIAVIFSARLKPSPIPSPLKQSDRANGDLLEPDMATRQPGAGRM